MYGTRTSCSISNVTKNTATFLLAPQENNRKCFYPLDLRNRGFEPNSTIILAGGSNMLYLLLCEVHRETTASNDRDNNMKISQWGDLLCALKISAAVDKHKQQEDKIQALTKICEMCSESGAVVSKNSSRKFWDDSLRSVDFLPTWRYQRDSSLELDEAIWPVKGIEVCHSEPATVDKKKCYYLAMPVENTSTGKWSFLCYGHIGWQKCSDFPCVDNWVVPKWREIQWISQIQKIWQITEA